MKKFVALLVSAWITPLCAVKFAEVPDVCVFHKHHETRRITAQKDLKSMADTLLKEVKSGFSQYQSQVGEIKRVLDQSFTTENLKLVRMKLQNLRNEIESSMDISMGYISNPLETIQRMISFIDQLVGKC